MSLKDLLLKIQPFTIILFNLILGILSYDLNILNTGQLTSISISILIISLIALFKNTQKNLKNFLIILFSILTFFLGHSRAFLVQQKYQNLIDSVSNKPIKIRGWVSSTEKTSHSYFKNKISIVLNSIKIGNQKIKTDYTLRIHVALLDIKNFYIGQYLEIDNIKIKNNKSSKFLISKRSLPNLFLNKIKFQTCTKKNIKYIKLIWLKIIVIRDKILKKLLNKFKFNTKNLFEYIFLGIKSENEHIDKIKQNMTYWGINHYLARSGLHLVLIIFTWRFFLKTIPFGYFAKQVILAFLSIVYSLLTIPSISFERALLSFIIYNICTIKKIPVNNMHIISMVCFITLFFNPYKLFLLDFQLSFCLTFALIVLREISIIKAISQKK